MYRLDHLGSMLQLPKESIVVMDREYNDYRWYNLPHAAIRKKA
ncbi:MAG: hypothetical protein AB2792_15205 [Candidatus Thiodiazotropha sp.]